MVEKETLVLVICSAVFVFSLFMIFYQNTSVTGYATTSGSTVSNVTISTYLSISFSTNLTQGIFFGTVAALPTLDQNASFNNDTGGTNSSMFINVSTDSNTKVDFCIQANTAMTLNPGTDIIGISNETYANSSTTNITLPMVSQQTALTTSYVKAGPNTGPGNVTYYRFWLDLPAATSTGTYNNTVMFKGIQTGAAC